MPAHPPIPAPLWARLHEVAASVRAARVSCRVVVLINYKQGEPVDGDVVATVPLPGVHSA